MGPSISAGLSANTIIEASIELNRVHHQTAKIIGPYNSYRSKDNCDPLLLTAYIANYNQKHWKY